MELGYYGNRCKDESKERENEEDDARCMHRSKDCLVGFDLEG